MKLSMAPRYPVNYAAQHLLAGSQYPAPGLLVSVTAL